MIQHSHTGFTQLIQKYVHTKTYIQMFITALLLIAQNWKQPRCPSTSEWTNCRLPMQWNITKQSKEMNGQAKKNMEEP